MTEKEKIFGRRMDSAKDKECLIEMAKDATKVLDLGAGTGKISRDITEKWGCHADAVDISFKDDIVDTELVSYHKMDILKFLGLAISKDEKFDCIIFSAILHELDELELKLILTRLPSVMADDCRIIIREPFYTADGPILKKDRDTFKKYVEKLPFNMIMDYFTADKLGYDRKCDIYKLTALDWLNACFALSYGKNSWEREKHELRYARSLEWCKLSFNFNPYVDEDNRRYTDFNVYTIRDESYKALFKKAHIPEKAFDLVQYTGMIITIDYKQL